MRSLYDEDILLWSKEQAAALRMIAGSGAAPAADWERLAALVEGVGRSALARVESGLRLMLVQAIAGYCDPDSPLRHLRIQRAFSGQSDALSDMSPGIREGLDLDRLWRQAFEQAVTEIPKRPLGVPPAIPPTCPFALDELLAEGFTYDQAVERLYILLTSWRPKAEKDPKA
ncbi:MAG TPA: DUF29 family protein [Microvirga sp.]|nr:DUF29 family protein [Microvirga sp.]